MALNYIEFESNDGTNKTLSVEEYLNQIIPYLKGMIILKKPKTWKNQITIANNFISSIGNKENVERWYMIDDRYYLQ